MFLRVLNRVEEAVICILMVSTTLLVFLDVVMRFGFNAGFLWSQELTLHMSGWFVLLGASYGLKQGSHIGMDAFVKLFPTGGQEDIVRDWLCSCADILRADFIRQLDLSRKDAHDRHRTRRYCRTGLGSSQHPDYWFHFPDHPRLHSALEYRLW